MREVDVYSMQIISQFVMSEEDLMNIIQINKKYRMIMDRMRINSIQMTKSSIKLFKFIETQQLYSQYDVIHPKVHHFIFNYVVDYEKYLEEKEKGNQCIKVIYTTENREKYGEIIPNGVNIIGGDCFGNSEFETISIPSSITEIRDGAFSYCTNLKEISIPDFVKFIGMNIFLECSSLTSVKLPSYLKQINNGMFQGCYSLKNIEIPNSVIKFGDSCFSGCGITSFDITENIKVVGSYCFFNNYSLKEVTIQNKIISDYLFCQCTSLTLVKMNDTVDKIESSAFRYCNKLKTIKLSSNLKSISESAFEGCTSLQEIIIPKSVEFIGMNCFKNCSTLTKLIIENEECEIEGSFIEGCDKLKEMKVPMKNGYCNWKVSQKEKEILTRNQISFRNVFYDISIEGNGTKTMFIENGVELICNIYEIGNEIKQVTSIHIPSSINSVGNLFCFDNKIQEIHIPKSVVNSNIIYGNNFQQLTTIKLENGMKTIQQYLLQQLNIERIEIPTTITSLSDFQFKGCSKLKEIRIPSSVVKIGNYVFSECSSLTRVNIENKDIEIGEVNYKEYLLYKQNGINCKKVKLRSSERDLKEIPNNCEIIIDCKMNVIELNEIPSNVVEINNLSFLNQELTSLTFPNSLNFIRSNGNDKILSKLKEITIESDLAIKCPDFIEQMTNLTKIKVNKGSLDDIEVSYDYYLRMKSNGIIFKNFKLNEYDFNKYGKQIPKQYNGILSYDLFEIANIQNEKQEYNEMMNEQLNHSKLTVIKDDYFYNCPELKEINLINIKQIKMCSFCNCSNLTSITLTTKIPSE